MKPKWFFINNLPFNDMWLADSKWIPIVLNGEKIEAEIYFNSNGSVLEDFKFNYVDFK